MLIKCNHIFSENNQSTCMWRQALTIDSDDPAGRRWMDGEKTEEEQSSQSRVKSECYVKAARPGLNHGLCRHHRAQVEGVEGLMGNSLR